MRIMVVKTLFLGSEASFLNLKGEINLCIYFNLQQIILAGQVLL